jgi:CheY-like chemotaxis protein
MRSPHKPPKTFGQEMAALGPDSWRGFAEPLKHALPERVMRVLVVEDNEDSLAAIAKLLTLAGHEPLLARNGNEAIAICNQTKPEFVLVDIALPNEQDGYSVAAKLRNERGLENVQIWALSAYPDLPAKRREAGIVGHIQKPLTFAHIQTLIGVAK